MADEKKTYLINIESNLQQYAEDAAKAKKIADELKASLEELKKAGATPAEIEAATAATKNANDEYRKAAGLVKTQIAANSSEAGSRKQLSETLKLQEQALGKLGNAYIINAKGQRELNPLYIEQRKRIKETKDAIIEYDQSLSDGRSNVGRYGAAVTSAFQQIGQSIIGSLGPVALIITAFNTLKETFAGMEGGAAFFSRMKQGWRTFSQEIVGGEVWKAFFGGSVARTGAISDELDKLRIADRAENLQNAKLENDVKLKRLESLEVGKTQEEQLILLTQAQADEDQIIQNKTEHLDLYIGKLKELLVERPKDTALLDEINAKEIEREGLRGESSLRLAMRIAALRAKEDAEIKKSYDYFTKFWDAYDKVDETHRTANRIKQFEYLKLKNKDNVDALEKILDDEYKATIASKEHQKLAYWEQLVIEQKYNEAKRQLGLLRMDQEMKLYDLTANIMGSMSDLLGKQTAEAKTLSVAQALISTYTAGVKAMAELPLGSGPVLRFLTLSSIIAAGLVQVKNILAVNVPGAGSANMPTAITASPATQRVFANQVGSTVLTQPQLSQSQLNAIPNQNLLTADQIINALKNMPNPVVTVEDINRVSIAKKKVEVRAVI
jgi:hypothetical protein